MTKQSKTIDYSNGKIYVIISPNHDLFYYGSTVKTIEYRFNIHKSKSSTCTSKKIIEAGNAEIFEIESYPCSCLEELEDREADYIINDWDGCVNKEVPGAVRRAGGRKAYQKAIDATPETKAYQKEYHSKPECKARKAEKIPCNVCGCFIRRDGKSAHQRSKTCQKFLKNELDNIMDNIITQIEQQQ